MIDVLVPEEQEGTKAVVRTWLKQVGDRVEENDPLVELETDKVAMEVPAPASGVLSEIVLLADAEAVPGAVLGRISAGEIAPEESVRPERSRGAAAQSPSARASTSLGTNGEVEGRLSPSVKRALLQHDIDPRHITGTGRNGRITRDDVDRAVEQATRVEPDRAATEAQGSRSIPHDRMRLAIAANMLGSVTTAPHVTAVFEADFSAVAAHRAALKAKGVKLTYTAYIVHAAAQAMKAAPAVNSRWHDDRLEVFENVDIGVGTALGDKGLVVPVVRGAELLHVEEIGQRLDALTEKARTGRLTPAEVRGGTFTISNHGVSGSLLAAPIIINQPQSAILGIGKLEKRVVVREVGGQDAILIRPMAYVSLTIDHRALDGHQTNAWLTRFVELIEGWAPA